MKNNEKTAQHTALRPFVRTCYSRLRPISHPEALGVLETAPKKGDASKKISRILDDGGFTLGSSVTLELRGVGSVDALMPASSPQFGGDDVVAYAASYGYDRFERAELLHAQSTDSTISQELAQEAAAMITPPEVADTEPITE